MRCVAVDPQGYLYELDPQPTSYSECSMVISSGADMGNSPFALTGEQGGQIGAAILLVWALAYGVRVLIRMSTFNEAEQE